MPLPVLFRFLLAFLFKIINVFVSSLYLQGWLYTRLVYIISCPFISPLYTCSFTCLHSTQPQNARPPYHSSISLTYRQASSLVKRGAEILLTSGGRCFAYKPKYSTQRSENTYNITLSWKAFIHQGTRMNFGFLKKRHLNSKSNGIIPFPPVSLTPLHVSA